MTVISKHSFQQIQNLKCSIFHPWHQNCIIGNMITGTSTVKGSSIFFAALYLIQYMPKYKELTKKDIIPVTIKFAFSVSTAVAYMFLFTCMNCFFRQQFGQFSYYIVAYVVPILCGVAIFLENPLRKCLMASSFASMCVEGIFRRIYSTEIIKRNLYFETLLFMICNGLLMYMVKAQKTCTKEDYKEMWFYLPHERKHEYTSEYKQPCVHHDSCFLHGLKETLKYFSFGFILSVLKTIWSNGHFIKTPKDLLRRIFMLKNLKLCIFVGAYVGIYKAINCCLRKKTGEDSELYGLFGGIAAGIPYRIIPSFTLLSSLIVVLLQRMGRKLIYTCNLPDLPYQEITFILSNAFLLNTRIFHSESCPTFFKKMLNACTNGRESVIYNCFVAMIARTN